MSYYRRWGFQEEPPPKSDSHIDEAFRRGESAARKEATDANRRENRSDARALAAAIAAVCARHEWKSEPGKKFAGSIRDDVRGELEASLDPKIQKKLLGGWPHWRTISRLIEGQS
jgi:hypothetical protein